MPVAAPRNKIEEKAKALKDTENHLKQLSKMTKI